MGGFVLVGWLPNPGNTDKFLWLRDSLNRWIVLHHSSMIDEMSDKNVTLLTPDFGKGKVFVFGSRGFRKKCLCRNAFFSDFWNGNTILCQTSKTGFKSVTFYDGWQLARLIALWYNLVIEIRRIIRLISGHLDKEKFADNFGEFMMAPAIWVGKRGWGIHGFSLIFSLMPLRSYELIST